MAKLPPRKLVAKGETHVVECAELEDGTSPAWEFLRALGVGMWEPDPDATELPSDEQIEDKAKFYAMAKLLADEGMPTGGKNGSQTNYLRDGVWEFKSGKKRLSWYDTDGTGGYEPKAKVNDIAKSEFPQDEDAWWFPRFDSTIRLGHAFPKTTQKTEEFDIDKTLQTRTEDLKHDEEHRDDDV